jgi:hypothetical protein
VKQLGCPRLSDTDSGTSASAAKSVAILLLLASALYLGLMHPPRTTTMLMPGKPSSSAAHDTSRPESDAVSSTGLPWIFPGDFRERLRMSDLVVAGILGGTAPDGIQVVDSTELTANLASLRIDRVFQGKALREVILFKWFALHFPTGGKAYGYSGPPVADFRPGKRYLVFLKQSRSGWEVSMPVYAIEEELAAAPPNGAPNDLSQAPLRQRDWELAEELENAALAQPAPPKGMTGTAASDFSSVFDLLGGCAEQFYLRFMSSPSPELRSAAYEWVRVIRSRHLVCHEAFERAFN